MTKIKAFFFFLFLTGLAICSIVENRAAPSGEIDNTFDYEKGNAGVVKINKAPEDIVLDDVDQAYKIKDFFSGSALKIWDEDDINAFCDRNGMEHLTPCHLAETSSCSAAIGRKNYVIFKAILEQEDCGGLKLTKMYYVSTSQPKAAIVSASYRDKTKGLHLTRDFVIDGQGENGEVAGGFCVDCNLFYTTHSLKLNKVRIHNFQKDTYRTFYIDTCDGIDQLQVTGCIFESEGTTDGRRVSGKAQKGSYIFMHSDAGAKPFVGDDGKTGKVRTLTTTNCINHVYVKGCIFEGSYAFQALDIRFVKSCRFMGNVFKDFTLVPLEISTTNAKDSKDGRFLPSGSSNNYYEQTKAYMSCPMYIVGNKFIGNKQIFKSRTRGYTPYACGMLVEGATAYILRNEISDIITGVVPYRQKIKKEDQKAPTLYTCCSTYDAYCNCVQVYYMNNVVKNIVRFMYPYSPNPTVAESGTSGIFKAKSTGNGFIKGGTATRKVLRHYKNNKYLLEPEVVHDLWKTWMAELKTRYAGLTDDQRNPASASYSPIAMEYDYDKALMTYDGRGTTFEHVTDDHALLSIRFCYMNTSKAFGHQSAMTDEVVISGNQFDAGKGAIIGSNNSNRWPTNSFSLCNNIFKAARYTSDQWQAPLNRKKMPDGSYAALTGNDLYRAIMSQNLFNVELRRKNGKKTTLNVIGNIFHNPTLKKGENCTIHLLQNTFTKDTGNPYYSDSHGDISNVRDNHYPNEGNAGLRLLSRQEVPSDSHPPIGWAREKVTLMPKMGTGSASIRQPKK